MPESQCGGRPGRGCVDQLFTLRALQELAYGFCTPIYAAFIDLAKAFDSISRPALFLMLRACGVPVNVMRLFESMYSQTACAVRCGQEMSEAFCTGIGIQQGCISGTAGFNLFVHFALLPIFDQLQELGVRLCYRTTDGRFLSAHDVRSAKTAGSFSVSILFIVDDTTILCESVSGLRRALVLIHRQFELFGLSVNVGKSFALNFAGSFSQPCTDCEQRVGRAGFSGMVVCDACGRAAHLACAGLVSVPGGDWFCRGCGGMAAAVGLAHSCAQESVLEPELPFGDGVLAWADAGKYLGVTVAADCGLGGELAARVRLARAAWRRMRPLLHGGRLTGRARGSFRRVFETLVGAVLLYGSECWALSAAELERLEVSVRHMLRGALPRSLRRPDGVRLLSNAALHAHFGVASVAVLLHRKQLTWLGHVARMDEARLPRRMLGALREAAGVRGPGHCESLLGVCGRSGSLGRLLRQRLTREARREFFGASVLTPWFELAADRGAWRRFVRSVR